MARRPAIWGRVGAVRSGIGVAPLIRAASPPSALQSRLDAGIASIVEDANRGEPIWWRQSAWIWGLPTWSRSGRPFRGLAALLLWRAAADWKVPSAWQEAVDPEDPAAVVVPMRSKRGWVPVAVVPGPRLGALPFPVPIWREVRIDDALQALRLHERPTLAPTESKVRELVSAFVQSLRRHPAPHGLRHTDWTVESLSVATRIAATAAESAYAAQVGTVFPEELVWQRGDVAAIFPWEAQESGGPNAVADRVLKREGARVLGPGHRPGQLPMRPDEVLRLDRAWEHGSVLVGYGGILQAMEALGMDVTGEVALDARALGLALAWKITRAEKLPANATNHAAVGAWIRLRVRVVRKSWGHRLHALCFRDLLGDRRWDPDRIIPRVRKVLSQSAMPQSSLSTVPLSEIGLVRLLDAMGPKRPKAPPRTADLLANIGSVSDRSYQRHAIFKADGTARWLDVPNPELAEAQRHLVKALRPSAPFAGVATAFEPGRSPALQARIHEGAVAAVVVDIADFFGSIRPRHLRWAFHPRKSNQEEATAKRLVLAGGSTEEREALLMLLFAGEGSTRWLPQGAPSSPWAANLAAHPMDRRLRAWARDWGAVRYSRYADDLALSLHAESDAGTIKRFLEEAEHTLRLAIQARGWTVKEEKTRCWRREDRSPLTLCGVEVPEEPGAPCRLPRAHHRRARAALHQLRCGSSRWDHGLLAWAWSATGQPGWLAWGSPQLSRFAVDLAGPLLAEALVGGWADSVDQGEGPE